MQHFESTRWQCLSQLAKNNTEQRIVCRFSTTANVILKAVQLLHMFAYSQFNIAFSKIVPLQVPVKIRHVTTAIVKPAFKKYCNTCRK